MKFFRRPWTREPDGEYVAAVRRSIQLWDRWKFWLILLHIGLLVVAVWVFSKLIPVLVGIAQPANAPFAMLGFVAGAVVGIAFGWVIQHIIHGLMAVLTGMRTERLLIKLLDAVSSEPSHGI